ncbi:prepilin-type N-terminal cleavage/methylation domain-containing protein [Chitinilyticum litopenaei]|uniref:prepilin-type N-terminal cleavage/methylation domain-containing protein n=1 Tax=Chitinilyticum litopenaei TaxID=1121276 RepID=UPI0003FCAD76|nr:prepilin-type N-terminal cleavage/methylation domain-containing protein [Chitinilyticum litopenaei]
MKQSIARQAGISLIEIMVSVAILATGMLALAKLHAVMLGMAGQSKSQSEALLLAKERIEELRQTVPACDTSTTESKSDIYGSNASGIAENYVRSTSITCPENTALRRASVAVNWTDRFGASQSINLISFLGTVAPKNALDLAAGDPTGGKRVGPSTNIEDWKSGTNYRKDAIVTHPNDQGVKEQWICTGCDSNGGTTSNTNNQPVDGSPIWVKVRYYVDGIVRWENDGAVHGQCTLNTTPTNQNGVKCSLDTISGLTVRVECSSATQYADCAAVTEQGQTKYYRYSGKYILWGEYSCAIANNSVTLIAECFKAQGGNLNSVGSDSETVPQSAAVDDDSDVSTPPVKANTNLIVGTNAGSDPGTDCSPTRPDWTGTVNYNSKTQVCYLGKIYVAVQTHTSAFIYPPTTLLGTHWEEVVPCTTSDPRWATSTAYANAARVCYENSNNTNFTGVIYFAKQAHTSSNNDNNNSNSPAGNSSLWKVGCVSPSSFSVLNAGVCHGDTTVTPTPSPTPAVTCAAASPTWTVGSSTCSGSVAAGSVNDTRTANSTGAFTGTASFTCSASNTWTVNQGTASCTQVTCSSQTKDWTVGGKTCSGTVASGLYNSTNSVTATAPNTGNASFTCSAQDVWTLNSGSTCAYQTCYATGYNNGTTYSLNAQVSYSGKNYRSLQNGNKGNRPDQNPSWWSDQGACQ